MQENWVDFRTIKSAITMAMVLDHYKINWLRKSGDELRGRCPIHKGEGQSTFHVSIPKNVFHCFSCKTRGNVLDFVAAMEQCSVRQAGLKLRACFAVDSVAQPDSNEGAGARREEPDGENAGNKPLTFRLQNIDHDHSYLRERGIDAATAERFGIGFYSGKGSMNGRIVIPIENAQDELVAYAGRSVDATEPKYLFPRGFRKTLELYNINRARSAVENPRREVVVVEGFFACLKLTIAGISSVALMGSTLSPQQEELLGKQFDKIWLMFDGDDAGRNGTTETLARLASRAWVRAINLADGLQPDSYSATQLRELLSGRATPLAKHGE